MRGCDIKQAREPELIELSETLADHTQDYINNGGKIEHVPRVSVNVKEIKEQGLIDVGKIMKKKEKRPKV